MKKDMGKVVTRFAPSPTGFIHVGGVRTALFAWAFARKHKGTFILRIEDTDKEREVEGSIDHIIESLKWLGIEWDEGPDISGPHAPYLQSERLDSYKKWAKILIEKGHAYADPYTPEQVDEFRKKSEAEKRPFLYRDYRPENTQVWDGTQALRFKTPEIKTYTWNDLVRGELSAGPEALDDFILIKGDGYPTYNFAHIIDDYEMGATHIFRADEFISSTPKFLSLYDALGFDRPEFATLPPILGPDGKKKLSKRDGAKDILDYRQEGYLPEALMNFLAFIGWNPGDDREMLSSEEFIEAFDLKHIQNAPAKFNEEKLDWLNREYVKKLPSSYIEDRIKDVLPEADTYPDMVSKIVPIVVDRIVKIGDIKGLVDAGELQYYFIKPTYDSAQLLCPEKLRKGIEASLSDVKTYLTRVSETLSEVSEDDWKNDRIKNALWDYATEKGRGVVLWAMRYSLSGKEKSPDPFTLAEILGKNETLSRLTVAIESIV